MHEDEESIDEPTSFESKLSHPPRAIFVRPLDVPGGVNLGDVYGLGNPDLQGCIMV